MEMIIHMDTIISLYMPFITLSFVVGLATAYVLLRIDKVPRYAIWCSIALNALTIAFGGMFVSAIMLGFKSVGLSSVGGAIGLMAAVFIITRIIPEYSEQFYKAYASVLPLMYSVSKLACHFSGCCYGREYDGLFCLYYDGTAERLPSTKVFPVQLCEVIIFAIIFIVGILLIYVKKAKHGIFALACICGIGKILLDYLRDSHTENMLIPSVNQIMCLFIIAVGAMLTFCSPIRKLIWDVRVPQNENKTSSPSIKK